MGLEKDSFEKSRGQRHAGRNARFFPWRLWRLRHFLLTDEGRKKKRQEKQQENQAVVLLGRFEKIAPRKSREDSVTAHQCDKRLSGGGIVAAEAKLQEREKIPREQRNSD